LICQGFARCVFLGWSHCQQWGKWRIKVVSYTYSNFSLPCQSKEAACFLSLTLKCMFILENMES
jgi:hypothetical protein